jgi:hypothetical protein
MFEAVCRWHQRWLSCLLSGKFSRCVVRMLCGCRVFVCAWLLACLRARARFHLQGWEPNPLVLLRAHKKGPGSAAGPACQKGCSLDDADLVWEKLGNPTVSARP